MPDDALSLINAVAEAPCSMDELGRRARAIKALAAPSRADALILIEHERRKRATWGAKGAVKENKDDEESTEV